MSSIKVPENVCCRDYWDSGPWAAIACTTFASLAEYCNPPEKVALRVLDEQTAVLDDAVRLIDRNFLPDDLKEAFKQLVTKRTRALG